MEPRRNNTLTQLLDDIIKITNQHKIDIQECDVFEEFLLFLAEVEEKPKKSMFGFPEEYGETFCVFSIAIDVAALPQLLTLNEKFPELDVRDVTKEVNQNIASSVPKQLEGQATLIIRISVAGLQNHILSKLDNHLKENQEIVRHYQRFSQTYDVVSKTLFDLFMIEGMDTHKSDCFEETLCHIVRESGQRATVIADTLRYLPHVLIQLIGNYLNLIEVKAEGNELVPTKSQFSPNPEFKYATNLLLHVPMNSAKLVERFFNQMHTKSAILHDGINSAGFTIITVDNQNLIHEGLTSDIKDAIKFFPQAKLDTYRKQSGTIKYSLQECREKLADIVKILSNNKVFHALIHSIYKITHHPIKDSVQLEKLINNIIVELTKIEESIKKNSKCCIFTRFSKYVVKQFKESSKNIIEVLENIDKIANKKFSPSLEHKAGL